MRDFDQAVYDKLANETLNDRVLLLDELEDVERIPKQKSRYAADLLKPPGLIGDIARYIDDTATRRMPVYSLAAAISLMSIATANRYVVSNWNTRLNVYSTIVGITGSGKAHPANTIKQLAKSAGFIYALREGVASEAAIYNLLSEQTHTLLCMDEIGHMLSLAGESSTWEKTVVKALLAVYALSGSSFAGKAYAKADDNVSAIEYPYLCVFGATTPQRFMDSLTTAYVHDGLLNRFLVFRSDELPDAQMPCSQKPDASVISGINRIHNIARSREKPHEIAIDDLATGELIAISKAFDEKIRKDPDLGAMWSRGFENTLKLAAICALGCCDNPKDAVIDSAHADWAYRVVQHSFREMIASLQTEQYSSKFDRDCGKVLKFVFEAHQYHSCNEWGTFCAKGLMPHSKLLKLVKEPTQYVKMIVDRLCETGEIRKVNAQGKSTKSVVVYAANEVAS